MKKPEKLTMSAYRNKKGDTFLVLNNRTTFSFQYDKKDGFELSVSNKKSLVKKAKKYPKIKTKDPLKELIEENATANDGKVPKREMASAMDVTFLMKHVMNNMPKYMDSIEAKIDSVESKLPKSPYQCEGEPKKMDYHDLVSQKGVVWALVGTNLAGKSSTAIEMAKAWKECNKDGNIICFDPQGVFVKERIVNYEISATDTDWATKLMERDARGYKFANSLLILDDHRMLLSKDSTPPDFEELLKIRKEIGMTIIYSTHYPDKILQRVSYYTTHYSIFQAEGRFSDKIAQYVDCQKASNLINQYVSDYGAGLYPNFPHVIVTHNVFECRNMDIEKVEALKDKLKGGDNFNKTTITFNRCNSRTGIFIK